jgi:hypothetical protein
MEAVHEDCFEVYVRSDHVHDDTPETAERPVVRCASYEEARRVQRALLNADHHCVIRYLGQAGGGD